MIKRHLILVGMMWTCGFAMAQEPASKDRPPLAKVPDMTEWTVSYQRTSRAAKQGPAAGPPEQEAELSRDDSGGNPPAPGRSEIKRVHNTLSSGMRIQETLYRDGDRTMEVSLDGLYFWKTDENSWVVLTGEEMAGQGRAFSPNGFPELSWVGKDSLAGEKVYAGITCDVYHGNAFQISGWEAGLALPSSGSKPAQAMSEAVLRRIRASVLEVAYIDQKTRLPVALETPIVTRRYHFSPLEKTPPPPPGLETAHQYHKESMERITKRYKIPQ